MKTGVTANTLNRMVFDAGAVYRDYGAAGQELIGATRGGATFTIVREDREVEVDGVKGPTKGLRRVVRHFARLEFTLLEMSVNTWQDMLRGTVSSDGTHKTITPDNAIVVADYYENIALVADVANTSTPCILMLLLALMENGGEITTDDQDEGQLGVTVVGHYDPEDMDTVPYNIKWPVSAS